MTLRSKVLMFAGLAMGLFMGLQSMPMGTAVPIVIAAGLVSVWGFRLVRIS